MKKRLLSIAICFVMVAGLLAGIALPIYAEEEYDGENVKLALGDTTWQENYKYFLNFTMEEIVLKKYIGSEENVVIPAKAVVGGATYNVRLNNDCTEFFSDCKSVKTVDFSALNTRNVVDTTRMFEYCDNLTGITGFNTFNVTKMASMFHNCGSLTSSTVSGLDTRNVTNMNSMFAGCTSLEKIPDFDTRNVTGMYNMFAYCNSLTNIDSNTLDTHNVETMGSMFHWCQGLTSANLSNWDTRNVESMDGMFYLCENLKEVDVSGFNTSKVTDLDDMFYACRSLENLDVSTWDVRNVTTMHRTFCACGVRYLDLSGWNLGKVEYAKEALDPCSRLDTIEIPTNLKADIEFGYWYYKQVKFARADDPTVIYTSLPKEQKESFTIVRVKDDEDDGMINYDVDDGSEVTIYSDLNMDGTTASAGSDSTVAKSTTSTAKVKSPKTDDAFPIVAVTLIIIVTGIIGVITYRRRKIH